MRRITLLIVAWVLAYGVGAPVRGPHPTEAMQRAIAIASAAGCSPDRWTHVYHASRLTVYAPCVKVTGTIVDATHGRRSDGVRKEKDGDTHGWLRVDPPFRALLNAGNRSNEGGNLVFEIVCYWRPTQADAVSACPASYVNPVTLPPVGTHVAIYGSLVQDDKHAQWMEIHPVMGIERLR